MAEWVDGRHVSVTHDGLLSTGDIAVATQTFDLFTNEIEFLWDLATELEFVEAREDGGLLGSGLADWRKSSYSPSGDDCVEIGRGIGIRDSKAPSTHIPVSADAWSAFLRLATSR